MSKVQNSLSIHKTPLLHVIEGIRKRLGEIQEFTSQNSVVLQDDIALNPFKASTNIEWSLNSALNHLQTSCNFGVPDVVTSMPSFTLLRAAIEHASLAIWLIDEDDMDIRRRNNLAFTVECFKQADKLEAHLRTNQKIRPGQQLSKVNEVCKKLKFASLPGEPEGLLSISKRVEYAGALLVDCGIGTEGNNLTRALYGRASLVTHANSYSAFPLWRRR